MTPAATSRVAAASGSRPWREITATPVRPPSPRSGTVAPSDRRHRRDRRQGAARAHARPTRVRHPDDLPAPAWRLRPDGRADHGAELPEPLRRRIGDGRPGDRPGHLRGRAVADDAAGRLPGTLIDGRGDLPRAREADARTPRDDADQLVRDRHRKAALGARLRIPAHRRLDPADGGRVRLRRCRARGHRPWLHRADRRRPSGWVRSVCSARASSSARPHRPRSRSSASSRSRSARSSCSSSGRRWARSTRPANRRPGPLGIRTPYPLAWVNPFLAQADVLCGTESTFGGGWCSVVQGLARRRTTTA